MDKLLEWGLNIKEYLINIDKTHLIIGCVVLCCVFSFGWLSRTPAVKEKVVMEQCSDNILKNKKGLSKWLYNKTRHLSLAQCERVVEVAFEGKDPFFVTSIILYESGGDSAFVSSAGAIGLGQIMPANFNDLKLAGIIKNDIRELFELDVNVRATQYMHSQKYKIAKKHYREGKIPKGWTIIEWSMRLYRGLNRSSAKAMKKDLVVLERYTNKILNAYWELKEINGEI